MPVLVHLLTLALVSVNYFTSALAQGNDTPTAPGSAQAHLDALRHPVWGPALRAEAASVAADAPARAAAEDLVARAQHGLSGWAQVRPALRWTHRDGDGSASVAASAGVSWRLDPVARASAELDRHRGDVAAHERARRAVREVTGAYIALRRAHVALALAEAALPARRATLERAEAGLLAGALSRTQRDLAALELERAEAAVQRSARDLHAAAHEARRHGIDVEAAATQHLRTLAPEPLEGWRLPLAPHDAPHETLHRRALERDLAAARLDRRGAWALLDDVRIETSYQQQGTRLRAGAGLDEGRPSAWADAAWTGSSSDAWSIGLSARLRVDECWDADLERAARALSEAEEALDRAYAEASWVAAEARRAVHEAEREVAFAERSLALGRAALRELGDELIAARSEARAASAHERDALEGRVTRLEDAYRRAELGHLRERDAFLRAWERYLREGERHWAGVGWPFSVALGGDVGE